MGISKEFKVVVAWNEAHRAELTIGGESLEDVKQYAIDHAKELVQQARDLEKQEYAYDTDITIDRVEEIRE